MNLKSIAALAFAGAALSGCASIVEGTTQIIAVTSVPSSEGTYYVTTPGNATVHKTKHNLDVVCKLDGFKDLHGVIESHFNGATAGNIIAGGIIGVGIDAATGANYNYPTKFEVTMEPADAAPVAEGSAPPTVTNPTPAPAPDVSAKPGS